LSFAGSFPTGGAGTGGGLGNQGSLAFDGEFLYAVNAGSNDLSVLRVDADGLVLIDTIASGGIMPVSVTAHRGLVYVLNAGSDNLRAGWTRRARAASGARAPSRFGRRQRQRHLRR
jgi:6-phosphogluconolactonase